MGEQGDLRVLGATIHGFAQACVDLHVVAGRCAEELIGDTHVMGWYPFSRLRAVERLVLSAYEDAAPIMERVGIEMMTTWYRLGPGRERVSSGLDFLHFQSGSQGYASVVNGPEELVGSFNLVELDERRGSARIHSTTPFNKDMERGVIIGGMCAPGDLEFVIVDNAADPHLFHIEF